MAEITSNAAAIERWFTLMTKQSPKVFGKAIQSTSYALKAEIQRNASGRPGPNAPTGDYRRSWTSRYRPGVTGGYSIVGTNKPQACRLEYGFWEMTDSLGRFYRQPAYPHVAPALRVITPYFLSQMRDAVQQVSKVKGAYMMPIGTNRD